MSQPRPLGPIQRVCIGLPAHRYEIAIAAGASALLPEILAQLHAKRAAVIADATVAALHGERLAKCLPPRTQFCRVPPGERSKSFEMAQDLYDFLARVGIERDDVLLTFGGGMICDLGGFVAATWMRGIRFVQVPTTTEAGLDASVGGKTAINHPAGKNLIGAFHQPAAVVIDTAFLETLSERDYLAGLAESVKHGTTRDPALFEWQVQHATEIRARRDEPLAHLLAWNCRVKAEVVAADEREQHLRAVLNHGHTIGHALEHALAFELRHGECVALGMLVENQIAAARGVLTIELAVRVRGLLTQLGLPCRLPRAVPAEAVLSACRADKKNRESRVNFVLLGGLGQTRRVDDVTDAEITAALACVAPD